MSNDTAPSTEDQSFNMVEFLQRYGAYLAFPVALAALTGSLYYSEIKGYYPCNLCWYQRILMYPLSMLILVGIFKQDEYLPSYVLPFSILGMALAFYHYLLQLGFIGAGDACGSFSCGEKYINYLGFITIPFQSLGAFSLITLVMGATWWAYRHVDEEAAIL